MQNLDMPVEDLIAATLTPAGVIYQCSCGDYYDPSDPIASYPHNNH